MKINLVCTFLAILICRDGSLVSGSPVEDNQNTDLNVPTNPTNEPEGYVVTPGIGALKFHSTPKTWNDARRTCVEEGAHLFILRSAAEEEIVKNTKLDNETIWQIWLGAHELFKNDEWLTVLDEPLDRIGYAPWRNSERNGQEPNHQAGIEHCLSYINDWSGTGLNDSNCEREYPFYCKKEPQCGEK